MCHFGESFLFRVAKERSVVLLEAIKEKSWYVRKLLGGRIRNQLKIVPELEWFIDDSLEYIENIDNLLKE